MGWGGGVGVGVEMDGLWLDWAFGGAFVCIRLYNECRFLVLEKRRFCSDMCVLGRLCIATISRKANAVTQIYHITFGTTITCTGL